jgi:hypothetical protein
VDSEALEEIKKNRIAEKWRVFGVFREIFSRSEKFAKKRNRYFFKEG